MEQKDPPAEPGGGTKSYRHVLLKPPTSAEERYKRKRGINSHTAGYRVADPIYVTI